MTPQQETALRMLPFTRKPADWDCVDDEQITRAQIEKIIPYDDLLVIRGDTLWISERQHPLTDFERETPIVFRLLLADGSEWLVNTEGYTYCRYIARLAPEVSRVDRDMDIVDRLRLGGLNAMEVVGQAADEIARLRREIDDRRLMMSMLIAQLESFGHEPVVKSPR